MNAHTHLWQHVSKALKPGGTLQSWGPIIHQFLHYVTEQEMYDVTLAAAGEALHSSITTGFANEPAGSPALVLTNEKDRYFGELSAGLDLTIRNNATLSLSADTAFSENTWLAGGSAKFRLKF